MPPLTRQELPAEILAELEKPVSARGDFKVYMGRPAPGTTVDGRDLSLRYFETAKGESYIAHVFGEAETVMTKKNIAARGIAVDRELAVAPTTVRRLVAGEKIPSGISVDPTCSVSGLTTVLDPPFEKPITEKTTAIELEGRIIVLCNGSHVRVLEDEHRLTSNISASGGSGGAHLVVVIGSPTRGTLYGRVTNGGAGVPYVLLNSSVGTKYTYTDADGYYALADLSTGSQTITPLLYGNSFTPAASVLSVLGGANTLNIAANPLAQVSLVATADARENGPNGAFTLTRGVDYPNLPTSVTIPDGQAGITLLVTPVDDSLVEGSENITVNIPSGGDDREFAHPRRRLSLRDRHRDQARCERDEP